MTLGKWQPDWTRADGLDGEDVMSLDGGKALMYGDFKDRMASIDEAAIAAAGKSYLNASDLLAESAQVLETQAAELAAIWKGDDAEDALGQLQKAHASIAEMAYESVTLGDTLEYYGETLVPHYKNMVVTDPFEATDGDPDDREDIDDYSNYKYTINPAYITQKEWEEYTTFLTQDDVPSGNGDTSRTVVNSSSNYDSDEHMQTVFVRAKAREIMHYFNADIKSTFEYLPPEVKENLPKELMTNGVPTDGTSDDGGGGDNPYGGGSFPGGAGLPVGSGGPDLGADGLPTFGSNPGDERQLGFAHRPAQPDLDRPDMPDAPSHEPVGASDGVPKPPGLDSTGTDLAGLGPSSGVGGVGGAPSGGFAGGIGGGIGGSGGISGPGGIGAGPAALSGGAGGPAAGMAGRAGAGGMGGMMPMMPMGGGGAGGGQGGDGRTRETWLNEDEDVWRGDEETAPPVIG